MAARCGHVHSPNPLEQAKMSPTPTHTHPPTPTCSLTHTADGLDVHQHSEDVEHAEPERVEVGVSIDEAAPGAHVDASSLGGDEEEGKGLTMCDEA